jgi:acylglycerol lipase
MTAPEHFPQPGAIRTTRHARAVAARLVRWFAALAVASLAAACTLQRQEPLALSSGGPQITGPQIADGWFTSFDGARLGLTHWPARKLPASPCRAATPAEMVCASSATPVAANPEVVIIALHGMNDYAGAFRAAGEWWAEQGAAVYAYDQRGFGRSPQPGVWPETGLLPRDLKAIVAAARRKHPDARIAVVGESMGAAVAAVAFASDNPPDADAVILSGPGFRGWSALPPLYSASLWASAHIRPDWKVVPPKGIIITPTDNRRKQVEMWYDPYVLKETRIDSVYGVVSVMDEASKALKRLPDSLPVLLLYGARDQVIPEDAVRQATQGLPAHIRSAWYADGYHMLMNDLQARQVWADVLAFARQPAGDLPSGSPELPWLKRG